MSIKKTASALGAVVIVAAVVIWVMSRGDESDNAIESPSAVNKVYLSKELPKKSSVTSSISSVSRKRAGEKKVYIVKADGTPEEGRSGGEVDVGGGSDAAADRADQAVERWDTLVDLIVERQGKPGRTQLERVKKTFDELDPGDKLPAINQALNLIPDEQFSSLYPILYDKGEPEEVLDAIFSDALNRDEEIKIPLMKELRKDKSHPMFFESARILDVII